MFRLIPGNHDAALGLAWIRATDSDENLCDGAEAVQLAKAAVEGKDAPAHLKLDVFADAYAKAARLED